MWFFRNRLAIPSPTLRLHQIDPTQQHPQFLLTQHDFAAPVTRLRPAKASFLETLRAHPQTAAVPEQNLQPVALRIHEQKHMAAQRVALQLIPYDPIQPVEALAHVCGSRRQIDARRRPKAEHRLQPLQHSHQSRQRRRIKAGANFDSAARADNDRQSYYRLLPSCRIHGWQLHCNQTAASTCAPSFLSFPQITIQSIQHYSVPAAKLARPQAALNKLFHHLLDRQCTATRTPHRNLLFAHANTSPQQPAIKQVRCSHAYEEVKAGTPVRVEVSAPDLKNWSSNEIVLQPGQSFIVSDISLGVATVEMAVNAATPEQVAVEQVKIEEQQRVFGVI